MRKEQKIEIEKRGEKSNVKYECERNNDTSNGVTKG